MRLPARLGTALLASLLLSTATAAQASRFDGTWSVEVVTEKGSCDRAYRYRIVVENGQARYGGPENIDVNGTVRPNGRVLGAISRGRDRASVTGRLSGQTGNGTWSTSGGRTCSGTWNAERRG